MVASGAQESSKSYPSPNASYPEPPTADMNYPVPVTMGGEYPTSPGPVLPQMHSFSTQQPGQGPQPAGMSATSFYSPPPQQAGHYMADQHRLPLPASVDSSLGGRHKKVCELTYSIPTHPVLSNSSPLPGYLVFIPPPSADAFVPFPTGYQASNQDGVLDMPKASHQGTFRSHPQSEGGEETDGRRLDEGASLSLGMMSRKTKRERKLPFLLVYASELFSPNSPKRENLPNKASIFIILLLVALSPTLNILRRSLVWTRYLYTLFIDPDLCDVASPVNPLSSLPSQLRSPTHINPTDPSLHSVTRVTRSATIAASPRGTA